MASAKHDFIVSAIVRRIRQDGFKVIYLDGKYKDIGTKELDIPPKIVNHKPDVIGGKENMSFCIGEAKTENDLFTSRTKNQIIDFLTVVRLNSESRLVIGIPLGSKRDLEKLLRELRVMNQKQIETIYVPEELLPHEEEI